MLAEELECLTYYSAYNLKRDGSKNLRFYSKCSLVTAQLYSVSGIIYTYVTEKVVFFAIALQDILKALL